MTYLQRKPKYPKWSPFQNTYACFCFSICFKISSSEPWKHGISGSGLSSINLWTMVNLNPCFFPQNCVGLLFLASVPPASSASASASSTLSNTVFHIELCHTPSFTYLFVTHHLSHTTLSHTIYHTQRCHTPSSTHLLVIHHLSHTSLSHTIFVTPSLSHHLSHTSLSHTICVTHLYHTPSFSYHLSHIPLSYHLSHTIFHTQPDHTLSFTHIFVTHHLSHTTWPHTIFRAQLEHRFAWQAWHLVTSIIVSRGRPSTWWHPPSFRVAGVALGDIHHCFAWQAWHLATSTLVSRGTREPY